MTADDLQRKIKERVLGAELRFEALNKLWETVRENSHDFRVSTEIFPSFDVEKVSRDFDLEKKATERGSQGLPSKGQKGFDEVEQSIIDRIEEEKKTAHQVVEDQFQTFADRMTNLDFEGQFGLIRQANANSVSDFMVEATTGANILHPLREQIKEAYEERKEFRTRHSLGRAARTYSGAQTAFKLSLLFFIVVLETWLNGSFLAKGSEQGIVGGISLAIVFSVLNVGIALLASVFLVRLIFHKAWFAKIVGVLTVGLYLALTIALNLALAHYREVSGLVFENIGTQVMTRLNEAPFQLADIDSWTLFGFGLLCSLISFIDGFYLTDPYPGYAGVEKRLQKARNNYNSQKEELLAELTEIRNEHNSKVEGIIRDLSNRRKEHGTIIAHRQRMASLFAEHQNQLERAANSLLTIYRTANAKARADGSPKYFLTGYKTARVDVAVNSAGEWNDQDLTESIRKAQNELTDQIHKVDTEFQNAVRRYASLDALFPEKSDG